MNQNIVLIGASGKLGYAVLDQLEKKHSLYPDTEQLKAYDLKSYSPQIFALDLGDKDQLEQALHGCGPKTSVLNVAAYTDVDGAETEAGKKESFHASVEGPRNLAHLANLQQFRLFHIATAYVYGESIQGRLTEEEPLTPTCRYAHDKAKGQAAIENVGGWVLATEALYGPNGPHFISAVLNKVYKEGSAQVVHDQIGSPTYTRDLADLLVKIALSEEEILPRGRIHAVNQGTCSRAEWAEEAVRYLQEKKRLPPNTHIERIGTEQFNNRHYPHWKYPDQMREGENLTPVKLVARRPLNCSLATPILDRHGLALRPWREALHDYLDHEYHPPK